jgi:hypothetical protein
MILIQLLKIQLLKSVMQMAGGFLWSRGIHDSDSIAEDSYSH